MKPKYKVGDWIRFQRDAKLVIGVVQYISNDFGRYEYTTDIGSVDEEHIKEVRSQS